MFWLEGVRSALVSRPVRAATALCLLYFNPQLASGHLTWPPCIAPRSFAPRHNSAQPGEVQDMVKTVGFESVDALIDATVPTAIRRDPMELGIYNQGFTESGIIAKLK